MQNAEDANGWISMSKYRGGDWVYLFVSLDNIPGNYRIVEGCYMVGLKEWWVRRDIRSERGAKITPSAWRPLFKPPVAHNTVCESHQLLNHVKQL
jgi:hypothetical protein